MKMKNYLLSMAVMLMGASLLTSCLSDDDDKKQDPVPVLVSNGAYVVCGGNMSNNIDGSLTYYDYKTKTASQKVFAANNGRGLGMTANDALVYGSKMYIVVDGENTVEVVDAKTLKSIKQIKTTELMGVDKGVHPRHITCYNGMIYVSTYGASQSVYGEDWSVTTSGNGYVAAIDTLSFSLKNIYTVGSFPEGLTVYNDVLYVCNSDYSACTKASISMIDLNTNAVEEYKNEKIVNPTMIAVAGIGIYVLDMGNYADKASGVFMINGYGNCSRLFDASFVAFMGSYIYAVNAPYGATTQDYIRYNIQDGSRVPFTSDGVYSPNTIGVDPISGHVFVGSYRQNADTGYPDYSGNAYVAEYDQMGSKVKEFDCGVGPTAIAFNAGIEYVKY